MSHATLATCLLHLLYSGEGQGELLLVLMIKHRHVSKTVLNIRCVPKSLFAKDNRNLFYLDRTRNQTSYAWPFLYC